MHYYALLHFSKPRRGITVAAACKMQAIIIIHDSILKILPSESSLQSLSFKFNIKSALLTVLKTISQNSLFILIFFCSPLSERTSLLMPRQLLCVNHSTYIRQCTQIPSPVSYIHCISSFFLFFVKRR